MWLLRWAQLCWVTTVDADMWALWRSVLVLLVVGAVGGGGASASASGLGHKPRRMAVVVLRPVWHRVSRRTAGDVTVTGRYVYIGDSASETHATVIDERTGKRLGLTPPAGCQFDDENDNAYPPLGGSWVVATCAWQPGSPQALVGASYELYSIPHATWMPWSPDGTQMCALDAECAATNGQDCSSSYVAIGERWIELEVTCGYHSYPSTSAFEQLRSGQVISQPASVGPGGNQILDLDSSTLTQTLCAPLQVPSKGTIALDGGFALESVRDLNGVLHQTYLERCGSSLHMPVGGADSTFAASGKAVLWTPIVSREIDGLLLPSLRRLELGLPRHVASLCSKRSSLICIQELALTGRTLYIVDEGYQVWTARLPVEKAASLAHETVRDDPNHLAGTRAGPPAATKPGS